MMDLDVMVLNDFENGVRGSRWIDEENGFVNRTQDEQIELNCIAAISSLLAVVVGEHKGSILKCEDLQII